MVYEKKTYSNGWQGKKDVMIPFLKKYWWAFVVALLLKKYLFHWDVSMNTDYSLFGTLLLFLGLVGFPTASQN